MKPFNFYTSKFAPEEETPTGSGDKKTETTSKIKVGGKEYEEADLSSAASLYSALQDPETGLEIITTLARKAGLLNNEGKVEKKTGETQKQAESRAAKKLIAKLGKNYETFGNEVGPVLDELISEAIEELRGSSKAESSQSKWTAAVDEFMGEVNLTKPIEDKMKELMEEAPPAVQSKTFNAQRYLTRMYKNACEELDIEPKAKAAPKSKRRPTTEDIDDDFPDVVVRDAPKGVVTLDDAVDAAMKGIRFRKK